MSRKKRRPHNEEHIDETWLIPYADLLTLLLALFILLFASSQIDANRFEQIGQSFNAAFNGNISFFDFTDVVDKDVAVIGEREQDYTGADGDLDNDGAQPQTIEQQIEQETRNLQALKATLDEYIKAESLETQLETELNSQQMKIIIQDNALFDLGSADVKPEAERLAQVISELLVEYPQFDVVVSGHTDNLPISTAQFRSNWDLSAYRALNFMKILLANEQLDPTRFSNVAHGEYQPIASNDTPEGRAQNRRVEISVERNIVVPDAETISVDE